MSEKHLTELLWKPLATKQGVKDLGLGKALAAQAALDPAKEPAKALAGLKEIAEMVVKLKKTYLTKTEVVAHLDEMLKEVKKTTPALEAMAKSAAAAVPAAVAAAPAKPPAPVKPLAAAPAAAKPPTAAPAPAKATAAAPAAAKPAPAKPAPAAKSTVEDEDEDEEKEAAAFKKDLKQKMVSALAQVKARAPGEPDQEKDPKPQLQFMAYLAGKTCAVVVGRRVGSATKKLLPEIAGGAGGGQFAQGECIFEKNAHTFVLAKVPGGLAKKLAAALQTETGQKYKVRVRSIDGSVTLDSDTDVDPDATSVGGNPAAEWKAKLAEWMPAIKQALAAKGPNAAAMAKLLNEASTLSKSGDMVQALAKLTECHGLATGAAAPAPAPAGESPADDGLNDLFKECRDTYAQTRKALRAELKLQGEKIIGTFTLDAGYDPGEVAAAAEKVNAAHNGLNASLIETLDTALKSSDPAERRTLRAQAAELVDDYLAFLDSNPLLLALDESFTDGAPRQAAVDTLTVLASKLSTH